VARLNWIRWRKRYLGSLIICPEITNADWRAPKVAFLFEKPPFRLKTSLFNRFERPSRRFGGNRVAAERQKPLKNMVFGDLSKSALQG